MWVGVVGWMVRGWIGEWCRWWGRWVMMRLWEWDGNGVLRVRGRFRGLRRCVVIWRINGIFGRIGGGGGFGGRLLRGEGKLI